MTFRLNDQKLKDEYDEHDDILYLWIDGPQVAVTYHTRDGHLVHLDPETRELVGITVMDYSARWKGRPIHIEVPQHEVPERDYTLQPA